MREVEGNREVIKGNLSSKFTIVSVGPLSNFMR